MILTLLQKEKKRKDLEREKEEARNRREELEARRYSCLFGLQRHSDPIAEGEEAGGA